MSFDLRYNGILLKSVLTREFIQAPRNDASGTDAMFQDFTVGVETVVSLAALTAAIQNLGISGAGVGGGSSGQVLQSARLKLMEHRGLLQYYQDGQLVLESDANRDCDNGPHVIDCRITKFSPATLKIIFTIRCSLVDCTNNPTAVISNRWSCADDVDANLVTTRTWRGRLRVSNIVNNPHAFRNMVVPVLNLGWKRQRMSFLAETNGLELAYEIEDRQLLGDAPPPFVVSMNGMHTEALNMGGQTGKANISVRLDGSPGADRFYMLERCAQIIHAKAAIGNGSTGFFREFAMTEYFGEGINSVEARAVIERWNQGNSQVGSIATLTIGKRLIDLNLPDYLPGAVYNDGPYGSASLTGLFICRLQSPCVNDHAMPQIANEQQEGTYSTSGADQTPDTVQFSTGSIPSDWGTIPYSYDHQQAIYSHCKIESHYFGNDGRVFCPIAKGGGTFGDGAATIAPVRIHPRTAKRVIRCEMERIGDWPKIWKPSDFADSTSIVHYIGKFDFNFRPPEFIGDGRAMFGADANYVFGLSRPPKDSESYQVGSQPWDTTNASGNQYPAAAFIEQGDGKALG